MSIFPDKDELPEDFHVVAEIAEQIMDVCSEYETTHAIRAISSTLSMVIVSSAPSRESAEGLVKSLLNTILEIIETMDNAHMAGWNEDEERTLQ